MDTDRSETPTIGYGSQSGSRKGNKMRVSKQDKLEAFNTLHSMLKPGDTVYTICDHVSRSGMSRDIRLVVLKCEPTGESYTLHPNYSASKLLEIPQAKKGDGLKMGGCGMDMGFQLVYLLGKAMWPDGTPQPHGKRNGVPDSDGGYALKHRWL
jgi:hypothetical protein